MKGENADCVEQRYNHLKSQFVKGFPFLSSPHYNMVDITLFSVHQWLRTKASL